jgi:hypothetical protein
VLLLILPVVLCRREIWSLTLREEHRLGVFDNRALRRVFGPKAGNGESCTMRSFIICIHPQISLGRWSKWEWGGRGMWHTCDRRGKCTRFWWKRPKEGDHSEDRGIDGRIGWEKILGWLSGGVEWIQLVQGKNRWKALVNAVCIFGFWRHGVS